jgi:predicted enzyme related to lactoylglutathione lyase
VESPFVWCDLRTKNAAQSRSFYEQLFGWDVADVPAGDTRVPMVGGEQPWASMVADGSDPLGRFPYMQIDDLDAATRRAEEPAATALEGSAEGPAGDVVNRRLPRVSLALMTSTAMLLLSSCAPDTNPVVGAGEDPAGFWMGLWHGIIFPITFVISLFSGDVSVYEVVNRGNWYDFGFILGVMMSLGGGGAGAGTKRRR